ncbi:MAG: ATPase, T2SS/T4P/T4SS family [Candidatus Omnitrophica bacterium]|jgi:type II secretory ATPase GspE/PulE/Tfp pilus assembly ATPase PilB-like protein|nr:ATPase, T2SS/T4P/T4SS family [Candidatus Omnitrophota bacterium]MDD3988416.1 ATPase, T2SS/T4P/T4SS family [Candidatus Omnitrophota bacterium]MDD4981862.1 ATPase, T2SS/T4P/T4SS family [Candidatus Omnitrophota bacterium]MDD5665013.1 ATPase, T2SS/T4P/T4SS family [Candidatus Omnitrophota bacterium]
MSNKLLGEMLLKKKCINEGQLSQALKDCYQNEAMLGKYLVDKGLVKEEDLLGVLSEQFNLPFYPRLKDLKVSSEAVKAVPAKLVQHHGFIPISLEGQVLTVAVFNPMDFWLAENIKLNLGFQVSRVLSTRHEVEKAIQKYYGAVAGTVDKIMEDKSGLGARVNKRDSIEDIEKSSDEVSVINLVNQIIAEAIKMNATDIHIEIYADKVVLRYRIDGVLREMKMPQDAYYIEPAIVSRIKIMCHLDVVEHRLPQDGRAKVGLTSGQEVDLRVSVLPGYFGENIVIRILPSGILLDLDKIGFFPDDLKKFEVLLQKPHGIILITGPTGSGKTTTLYAALSRLNRKEVKIISIEDPVEYAVEGITQIHVNPKVGLTFADALRSVLRHDPDIMMIGEIRDSETADLAIRSALTGHLVFSTLHTNDSASGVARLMDMGIESYLLASSVEVIIAQRLVRLLCPSCSGKGCEACSETGFKGRRPIYEIMIIDDDIRNMIIARKSSQEIKAKAREKGMHTLMENGMLLVEQGLTTREEILRVVELE